MIKYFDATVDGWKRIAIVESGNEFGFDGFHDECDAPPADWEVYEQYARFDAVITVRSPNGD